MCELPPESSNLVPVAAEQSPSLEILSVAGPRKQRRLEISGLPAHTARGHGLLHRSDHHPLLLVVWYDQDMSGHETNSEYLSDNAGSEEPDSNMWNEALFSLLAAIPGPGIQHCLEDEELVLCCVKLLFCSGLLVCGAVCALVILDPASTPCPGCRVDPV